MALTFDAEHPNRRQCPPGTHDRIVACLADEGIRATFFLQGRWVTAYPDAARRIAEDRHLIGSHSDYHVRMPLLSDDGLAADVQGAEEKIRTRTGVDPRPWFRCPFGAGHEDPRVLGALKEAGYRNVHWDVEGEDWEDDQTVDVVERLVVERTLEWGDGAVVLLHTWPAPTLAALPAILRRLRDSGATFTTVDQMIGAPDAG